jgi:hypothetical protein
MNRILVAMVIALVGAAPHAASAQLLGLRAPIDLLLNATELHDHALGFGSERTRLYEAFATVYWSGPSATVAGRRLVGSQSAAARVYGYLILQHAAPDEARAVTSQLVADTALVDLHSGCTSTQRTVGDLVTAASQGVEIIVLPERPRDAVWHSPYAP